MPLWGSIRIYLEREARVGNRHSRMSLAGTQGLLKSGFPLTTCGNDGLLAFRRYLRDDRLIKRHGFPIANSRITTFSRELGQNGPYFNNVTATCFQPTSMLCGADIDANSGL